MAQRHCTRALALAALFPFAGAALGATAPRTMVTMPAATDPLAAGKCIRASFPFMTRIDGDHVVCLLSAYRHFLPYYHAHEEAK